MFHIKICGIRQPPDVKAVHDCGGDAIGLNFYEKSVRYVDATSPQTATLSRLAQEAGLCRVGVFVNASADEIRSVLERVELDVIQLHGDETVDLARELIEATQLPVIRAIKLPAGPLTTSEIEKRTAAWIAAGCGLLLEADAGEAQGGSGLALHWASLEEWSGDHPDVTWVLAGGLNPENVGEAMLESGAQRVDVASGVEETRGMKSEWLIRRFVVEARAAMEG